jgi:hypothetical protein
MPQRPFASAIVLRRRPLCIAVLAALLVPLALCPGQAHAAASDFRLEVNVQTGDVSMLATKAASFTGYFIRDPSGNLLDSGGAGIDNDYVLSVAAGSVNSSGAHGNTTSDRNSANWQNWSLLEDDSKGISELQNIFSPSKPSTFDTISLPANAEIDFGRIFDTAKDDQDLELQFSEPATNGNPVAGSAYGFAGVAVDYVPEPVLLLAHIVGIALLMRRSRWASARP